MASTQFYSNESIENSPQQTKSCKSSDRTVETFKIKLIEVLVNEFQEAKLMNLRESKKRKLSNHGPPFLLVKSLQK